ncbi:hypothetical protein ABIC70_005551 [Methylobacterium sp. 1973]
MIARFRLENGDHSPVSPLLKLIEVTDPPELALAIARSAFGIAKQWADELIRAGRPAIIEVDAYKRQFRSFIQRHNLPDLLVSLAPKPVPGDIEALLAVRPTFVRQLEIIEAGLDETSCAVSDYLRTSADKTMWAEQGLLYVLEQARHERRPSAGSGLVCHSDRGSHYVSIRYTERLTEAGDRDGREAERPVLRAMAIWHDVVWPIAAGPLRRRHDAKADPIYPAVSRIPNAAPVVAGRFTGPGSPRARRK